jgi:hypothetical protein
VYFIFYSQIASGNNVDALPDEEDLLQSSCLTFTAEQIKEILEQVTSPECDLGDEVQKLKEELPQVPLQSNISSVLSWSPVVMDHEVTAPSFQAPTDVSMGGQDLPVVPEINGKDRLIVCIRYLTFLLDAGREI